MKLKELRKKAGITQVRAANMLGVALRTYKEYENNNGKEGTLKYIKMCDILSEISLIDETRGILKLDDIVEIVTAVLRKYDVEVCYLFGSYAREKAKPTSDVDLLIDGKITGMKYYELAEELRESLNKKVDLSNVDQLVLNKELLQEILKDGIKIYDKKK